MTSNAEAAEIFRTIADLLDLLGEKFKPEAYRRAARSIDSLTEDLRAVATRGELRQIPGVGEAISEKIEEYLRTGTVPYFERLKREVPPGLVELMRLPGLGPKTARRFWVELGVEGPTELTDAIAAGRLNGLKGFGDRKIEQFRSAIASAAAGPTTARRPIEEVYPVARSLVDSLRAGAPTDRIEVAGSFRRARETVGDLDILVTSKDPVRVFDVFTKNPLVADVRMRGDTKETVLLTGGLQVDLRVVQPEEFGAALQYFTGSKDHNVRLRSLARDRGLKVNEYGVFRGEERVAGSTEEDVYASLGLAWIPPELREDRGEIDAAAHGTVPVLVNETDIQGDLHLHLPAEATPASVDALVSTARARRCTYVGVVVGGVGPDGALWTLSEPTRARIDALSRSPVRLLRAIEQGPGPVPSELQPIPYDYGVLRPANVAFPTGGVEHGDRPTTLVAHVPSSGFAAWIDRARTIGAAVEVGPGPERLDSIAARQARERGISLHVPIGLGAPADDPTGPVALGLARRAGARAADLVNARGLEALSIERSGPARPPKGRSSGRPTPTSGRRRSA